MLFKYQGKEPREIPALEISVKRGDEFEAKGDLAAGLLDQTDLYVRIDDPKKEN